MIEESLIEKLANDWASDIEGQDHRKKFIADMENLIREYTVSREYEEQDSEISDGMDFEKLLMDNVVLPTSKIKSVLYVLKPYLRTTEPVSLPRKDALRAYLNGRNASGAESMNLLNSMQKDAVRHEGGIAAVLDAAGVKYVD